MAAPAKLMMCAGLAFAGLGLIGAGAGATFTAQAGGATEVTAGVVRMTLNGHTGTDVDLHVDGKDIGTHFAPISKDLRLRNIGTLDLESTSLAVTSSDCHGGDGARLARALHVRVTDVTHGGQVYDGPMCSFASAGDASGARPLHHELRAHESTLYRLELTPEDSAGGLPMEAQDSSASVKLVFTGSDY